MKKLPFVLVCLYFYLFSSCFAVAETITIKSLTKKLPKHHPQIYTMEKVSIAGKLQTVPMAGAMITLQSTNFGQVLLFRPFSLPGNIQDRLKQLEAKQLTVTVSGIMLTICSPSELRQDSIVGCREFDNTKTIGIKPW